MAFVVPSLICRQGERVRKDTGNTVKLAQMIGVGDGREPCNRMAGECYQISLWKWGLGSGRILYSKDSHNGETICPQIKWGNAWRIRNGIESLADRLIAFVPGRFVVSNSCVSVSHDCVVVLHSGR